MRPGIRLGLDSVRAALDQLGHPEETFASVIVAGTNGKGSVSAMLESALRHGGYRTGLYTSPHLVSPRERIQIEARPVSGGVWRWAQNRVAGFPHLTEFELQTLAAFLAFARAKVEVAVLEVGLGGRLDAVNAVAAPEVCVITSIGRDHTEWLGPTLRHIYREKRGVARRGTPLIQSVPRFLWAEARAWAREEGVPCRSLGKDIQVKTRRLRFPGQDIDVAGVGEKFRRARVPFWGDHQARNGALVLAALDALVSRGWRLNERDVQKGMAAARWPGRFEIWRRSPPVVLDGAHNPDAMKSLVAAWRSSPWGAKKATVVFSCLKDKEGEAMVRLLKPLTKRAVVVKLASDRSRSTEELGRMWKSVAVTPTPDFRAAWSVAQKERDPVLVTGSLYLVGEAKKFFGGGNVLGEPKKISHRA